MAGINYLINKLNTYPISADRKEKESHVTKCKFKESNCHQIKNDRFSPKVIPTKPSKTQYYQL
jgi:hypothetical protein